MNDNNFKSVPGSKMILALFILLAVVIIGEGMREFFSKQHEKVIAKEQCKPVHQLLYQASALQDDLKAFYLDHQENTGAFINPNISHLARQIEYGLHQVKEKLNEPGKTASKISNEDCLEVEHQLENLAGMFNDLRRDAYYGR